MPCFDGREESETRERNAEIRAMLCRAMDFLEGAHALEMFFKNTDWAASGVTEAKARAWWTEHKRQDAARLRQEQAERDRVELANSAASKLSPAELAALRRHGS